jgi:site-specific recombinase XerD
MAVNLTKRKNANGTTSLIIDYRHQGKRYREFLNHLQLCKPASPADREFNKRNLQLAEAIRVTKAAELQGSDYNVETVIDTNTSVIAWMNEYIESYTKADKRNMSGALGRFEDFLASKKIKRLTFKSIDVFLIEDFIEYLEKHQKGEGPISYYKRFKKMLKHAYRKGYLKTNVLDKVERVCHGKAAKKDVLSIPEIQLLSQTPINSPEVRKAALFSCVTGLAWVDVKKLTWSQIKLQTKTIEFVRSKQKKDNVTYTNPLNDTAITLLGEPQDPDKLVFDLPTPDGANATLKDWVKRAKIDKKITWHNLRHSFGTNLIYNNIDILTTSKLLGHASTKHTERYIKASEEMLRSGTDKINIKIDI